MEKKSKVKKAFIIAFCILLFVGASFLLGYVLAVNGFLKPLWLSLIVLVGGVFVSTFVHIVIHELGHYFGGKAAGYRLMSFRIGFIKIVRVGDKIEVKLERLKDFGGVCQMIPVSTENIIDSFIKYVRGGLIGSIVATALFAAFAALPFVISVNKWLYLVFASGFAVSLVLDFINFRPAYDSDIRTDAGYIRKLKAGGDEAEIIARTTLFQAQLMDGRSPSEIDERLISEFPHVQKGDFDNLLRVTYLYSRYLDLGDKKKLIELSKEIESEAALTNEIYRAAVLTDVLYTECAIKKDEARAKELYGEVEKQLNSAEDVSAYRIRAAYNLYALGDAEKAETLCREGLEKKDSYLITGLAKMEEKLLKGILAEIVTEKRKREEDAETPKND